MVNKIRIEQINGINDKLEQLAELLIQVVEDGASIGFLPPLSAYDARTYWESVLNPGVVLFVAQFNNEVVGSVQLQLCTKQNGTHRAEIAKLMTHPQHRRKGIGRSLMLAAEERANQEGRTLIVLDTREGDPSNELYGSLGYIQAGRIPHYAQSATGELDATIYYYKLNNSNNA